MSIPTLYAFALAPSVLMIVGLALVDVVRQVRIRRARRALTAATLEHLRIEREIDEALRQGVHLRVVGNAITPDEVRRFRDELDGWGA